MTDITPIPLGKLVVSEDNVRRTAATDAGLQELAASIAAHGLLQSLVVRKHQKGKFAVVAGGRRLAALQLLAEQGRIEATFAVPCQVRNGDDAAELSLAENVQREPMHPADEFEAFRALVDGGMAEADVAARFGVTEAVVRGRLRLACVSPAVMEAYRGDRLSLAQVMAFTVSDDHALQDRVFENLSQWNDDPNSILDALTEHEIAATDRRVRFVSLAAYEQAGGGVRRDLFCEDDSGIFVLDVNVLDRLAARSSKQWPKLCAPRAGNGSRYVRRSITTNGPDTSAATRNPCRSRWKTRKSSTPSALNTSVFRTAIPMSKPSSDWRNYHSRSRRLRSVRLAGRRRRWRLREPVVCIDDDGEPEVRCDLVSPGGAAAHAEADDDAGGAADDSDDDDAAGAGHGLPCSLVESLTTHRTAALGAALSQNARVALAPRNGFRVKSVARFCVHASKRCNVYLEYVISPGNLSISETPGVVIHVMNSSAVRLFCRSRKTASTKTPFSISVRSADAAALRLDVSSNAGLPTVMRRIVRS